MFKASVQNRRPNKLLASLPSDVLAEIKRDLKIVSPSHGHILQEAGEPVDTVYFPEAGMISLIILTKDGQTIEASTVGREGAAGLQRAFGPRLSFTRATVQIPGYFATIPASRLEAFAAQHRPVRDMVERYLEILWAEAQQIAACNAVHDANSRLCRWLLQAADRIGQDEVPLTQEFLGQMLGVRRTTVTLLAQALQLKGLLRYSRGHIHILDRPNLEASACECYRAMHQDTLPGRIGLDLALPVAQEK